MKSPLKFLFMLFTLFSKVDKTNTFHLPITHDCAISLVKASTSILPQFDSIGHFVLHANEVLINKVLSSQIDPTIKKKLILQIIDMARQGDEMGGKILQDYYNFVDYLL